MKVSQQDLIQIVEQASTLTERLSNLEQAASSLCFVPNQAINEKVVSSRCEAWCQVAARGDRKEFAKRLAWEGVNTSTITSVFDAVQLVDPVKLPDWAETLKQALELEKIDADVKRCLNPQKPIPFEEVFLPFIQIAHCKLNHKVGKRLQLLTKAAQTNLERQLLLKLASLCAQSLQAKFLLFKTLQQSSFTRLINQLQNSGSNEQYQTFIKYLKTGGLLSFFQQYSVLARLVVTTIDFWVEEKAEFLQRLALDLPAIKRKFQNNTGQVVEIQSDLSDPHNCGRVVIALTFASGLKLIYKPRSLGMEAAYFQLLAWCNQQKTLLPFKLLKILDYNTHGWMEYVEHFPCSDEAAVRRYYQRAGILLCLLYVLHGNDCHQENLIASGEHPMLVDLETLLHPDARETNFVGETGAQYLANQQVLDSVLRSGLLPSWDFEAAKGEVYDISGLGGVGTEVPIKRQSWQHINTDKMAWKYETVPVTLQNNTPFPKGLALSPNNYLDQFVNGFQQMYQFLIEQREALLAISSPLANFAHQKVRFVFRNTQVYSHILDRASNPKFLRHGIDRSIQLDLLSRAFLTTDTKPSIWPLLAVELEAMEQMDIPYFFADSSSDALTVNPNLTIKEFFQESGYDRMISKIQELNEADLTQQIAIIQSSFYSRVAQGMTGAATTDIGSYINLNTVALLSQTQLIQEAVEIANELQKRAVRAADGSITWIGMGYLPKVGRLQLQPLGSGFYDGVCGVALFLAALAKITDDQKFRDLAISALQDLSKTLQELTPKFQHRITKQIGIGGATGVGSIVYTLVLVSEFLAEPDLLDTASLAATLITPESIAEDRNFDPIAGSAGAILGLLTLYRVKADPAILEQAQTIGYHLLNNRTKSDSGFRAWATLEGKLATGFSHGAAGIAYALLRLYETIQTPIFLEAAEEAINYERSAFFPNAGNWLDVRISNKPSFMTSWCHGAPGISLARLGSLSILDTPEVRQEIEIAINTTQKFGLENLDHLCCGNFGRMEMLLVAAQKLSRLELKEIVLKQATQVVNRARKRGSFYLFPELAGDLYNPGFFQGTAGIGYQLLRLAYPDSLPCVLMWE